MSALDRATAPARRRSTRAEVEDRRAALACIVSEMNPMTVRQAFYQATISGVVEKSERGYATVQSDLVWLRRQGIVPFDWIVDNTRYPRGPRTWPSIADALSATARSYRKALWEESETVVQVWIEKDALSGVIWPVIDEFDVTLMVARGYASLSFLHDAAETMQYDGRPAQIYHLGDFDPSGVDAARKIEAELRQAAPEIPISFERLAVTERQIADWNLPSRPTKASDTRSKHFGAISVELDAIPPQKLRDLVRAELERHLPRHRLDALRQEEAAERLMLAEMVRELGVEL